MNIENLKRSAFNCNEVITLYRSILDSYVSDFYLENHWNKNVPESWKQYLEQLELADLGTILDYKNNSLMMMPVAPLTIQCVFKILNNFSIPREQVQVQQTKEDDFEKYLWKSVKMKKRHETTIMASLCYQSAQKTDCFKLIDVGSGLGHLSRVLAFKYGFEVISIEELKPMCELAPKIDQQLLNILKAKGIRHRCDVLPKHINMRVDENVDPGKFGLILGDILGTTNFRCGIVGLHPCGNLAATILRVFRELPNIKFINMASCCYMKLTPNLGFPLSSYFIKNNIQLDYLSKEVACHALENYLDKLNLMDEETCFLKIHSYRAALESILVNIDTNFAHGAICNVKFNDKMTFKEYALLATKKHNLDLGHIDFEKYEVILNKTWLDMVRLSILRMLLAPLVESSILYDRLLYLLEQVNDCNVLSAFDCRISPRNQVISCTKC